MGSYHHNQPPVVTYPPPSTGGGPHLAPPPPIGNPTKDGHGYDYAYSQNTPSIHTKTRGDGFWNRCCVALCCCCLLDQGIGVRVIMSHLYKPKYDHVIFHQPESE